jgi:hypothetical protein
MDEEEIREYQERRETFLTIFLTLLAASAILFCLILVTGGFFLWVLVGLAFIAVAGAFHYFLWGKLFSDRVAGEREEISPRAEEEDEEVLSALKSPPGSRPTM